MLLVGKLGREGKELLAAHMGCKLAIAGYYHLAASLPEGTEVQPGEIAVECETHNETLITCKEKADG